MYFMYISDADFPKWSNITCLYCMPRAGGARVPKYVTGDFFIAVVATFAMVRGHVATLAAPPLTHYRRDRHTTRQ